MKTEDNRLAVHGQNVGTLYPGVSVTIERITPDVAREMLKLNVANRDRKREPIAKAIKDGEWTLNGATIVFSDDNVLLDGQNRLFACVDTGEPIDSIVVRGISRAAQVSMDTGMKRSVADYLKMRGYVDYSIVSSVGAALYRADCFGVEKAFRKPNLDEVTVKGTLAFIEGNYAERICPLVTMARKVSKKYPGFNTGTSGVLMDEFRKSGDENMRDFFERLVANDASVSSIALLSGRLTANSMSRVGKLPQHVIAALTIKAWNAYIMGSDMKQLKFSAGGANPEAFPIILLGYDHV